MTTATASDPRHVFYCSCNAVAQPDLRMFNATVHRVLVCDEARPSMILANKELLQATNNWIRLGVSATNCHSYEVMAHGVKIIILSSTWSAELKELSEADRKWVVANQLYTRLLSPLFCSGIVEV